MAWGPGRPPLSPLGSPGSAAGGRGVPPWAAPSTTVSSVCKFRAVSSVKYRVRQKLCLGLSVISYCFFHQHIFWAEDGPCSFPGICLSGSRSRRPESTATEDVGRRGPDWQGFVQREGWRGGLE